MLASNLNLEDHEAQLLKMHLFRNINNNKKTKTRHKDNDNNNKTLKCL